MKQKIVIKVHMSCDKCRSKALAVVAATGGVDSVALAGDDQVVVVGEGVDSVKLTNDLRKKMGRAQLMQVGEHKKEEEKKKAPAPSPVTFVYDHPYCPPPPRHLVCYDHPYGYGAQDSGCSVM